MSECKLIKIGITGQSGFVGTALYNEIGLSKDKYESIPFKDSYFSDFELLRKFVRDCDVIVHLAAINRHEDQNFLYEKNIQLVQLLVQAIEIEGVHPHVLFSSSTQESLENNYGKSKYEGRKIFENWARESNSSFTGLIVPNVFGPFGLPNYNSFIATFCYKIVNGNVPAIIEDNDVKLIFVGSLCRFILDVIDKENKSDVNSVTVLPVPHDFKEKVSKILSILNMFKAQYYDNGIIPELNDRNIVNLFNTFRSYIDHQKHFPVYLNVNNDERGIFVETFKLGVGGLVSFSTTVPNITRGNHYHTRKIERFVVIRGKALIQLRQIGTSEVMDFVLDGNKPSYVDMPIWYTHNIKNIGDDELVTQFWINEWYDEKDSDTYFEKV